MGLLDVLITEKFEARYVQLNVQDWQSEMHAPLKQPAIAISLVASVSRNK